MLTNESNIQSGDALSPLVYEEKEANGARHTIEVAAHRKALNDSSGEEAWEVRVRRSGPDHCDDSNKCSEKKGRAGAEYGLNRGELPAADADRQTSEPCRKPFDVNSCTEVANRSE